jgi:hypothetical protein
VREGGVLDGQQWDMADDGRVRRPWRRIAVPGEGPANIEVKHAHEHRCAMGSRSVYLEELEFKRRELSTTGSSSDGSSERRLRVRAIPAEEGWGLG